MRCRAINSEILRREIMIAFPSTPVPKKDELVYDNTGYHLECAAIKRFLKDKPWPTVTVRSLCHDYKGEFCAMHHFLTTTALRYYLPSLLTAILDDFEASGPLPERILWLFTVDKSCHREDFARMNQLIGSLKDAQIGVLRKFFRFAVERSDGDLANDAKKACRTLARLRPCPKHPRVEGADLEQ